MVLSLSGFCGFHRDIRDVVFQVKQIEAEKSLDPVFSLFFFQIVTSQWPKKHGEQEIRDFQKNPRVQCFFKIRDVNSWQWIHQTESDRWLS